MHPPNDVRHFVHRRLGRGIKTFVSSGFNPIAGAASFLADPPPSRRRGGSPIPRTVGIAPRRTVSKNRLNLAGRLGIRLPSSFAPSGGCGAGKIKVKGICVDPGAAFPGGEPLFSRASGAAVMGQFGAGMTPLAETRTVRSCLPGMVLGKDGLCYNRRDISNKERAYPKGRRPLGTPAELAALSKAASFGRRMENTVKRMQKIGVLKRPGRRSAPRKQQRLLGPGVVQIQQE